MGDEPVPTVPYGTVDAEYAARLAATRPEDDGPVWMVNLMHYRDRAVYADGRASELSGRQADDAYAPLGPLAAVGAEVVLFADVDSQLLGDRPRWDRVAVVRYPTRRAFLDMQRLPAFRAAHEHKAAGMAATFVIGCVPIPWPEIPADAPPLDAVPHPSTAEDGPVEVIHVLRYADAAYPDMEAYTETAGTIAVPHGVRIAAWFRAEGTIVGDGRQWDQVRFNSFPSKAAFLAVVLDPRRLEAQARHREVAIADTYTMILRPTVDRLASSVRR